MPSIIAYGQYWNARERYSYANPHASNIGTYRVCNSARRSEPEKAIDHESQIEPWLAPDNLAACWSQNELASSPRSDENR